MKNAMIAISVLVLFVAMGLSVGSGNALGCVFSFGALAVFCAALPMLPGLSPRYNEIEESDIVFTFIPRELTTLAALTKIQEYETTQQALETFGLIALPNHVQPVFLYDNQEVFDNKEESETEDRFIWN